MLLLRTALLAFISLLLIIVGALYFGYHQPEDLAITDINLCDDHFCVLGITPNVTHPNNAKMRLESDPRFQPIGVMRDHVSKRSSPFYEVSLHANMAGTVLTQIAVLFPATGSLTASMVVAKFGSPCAISFAESRFMVFTYPGMDVYFMSTPFSTAGRLEFTARVTLVMLNASSTPQTCLNGIISHDKVLWRGFRRYEDLH